MGPDIEDPNQKGLLPRMVEDIFGKISASTDNI
jgi:hypothetical protein